MAERNTGPGVAEVASALIVPNWETGVAPAEFSPGTEDAGGWDCDVLLCGGGAAEAGGLMGAVLLSSC